MANVKKVIMSLFIIMMVLFVYVGCSYSQEKPPEEEIQGIIIVMELGKAIDNPAISDLQFDNFQITNGFVSKTPGGGGESGPYCIEVNYKISYILTINHVEEKRNLMLFNQQQMAIYKEQFEKRPDSTTDINQYNYHKRGYEKYKNMPDIEKVKKEIIRDNIRLSFVKKGVKWYGSKNWM